MTIAFDWDLKYQNKQTKPGHHIHVSPSIVGPNDVLKYSFPPGQSMNSLSLTVVAAGTTEEFKAFI